MAGAASEVYEPLNQYKPVARNIGIVDGPFEYLTTAGVRLPLPFTTRMTVVRLGNGDLFIHSPIAFEPALADRLQAMGTVRHLVSPNQFHYAHIGEWSRAFPGAIAWASPRARKRAARGASMCISIETSASNRRRNGAPKLIRPPFPEEFSGRLFSSTRSRKPSYWLTPS
jgi:hypothetical protein